ncbi:hypothetical protein NK8_81590 (plasmid) [Caballeronia sp. NK8]|nr:hypothetical protein NK8_81590 [Caballeronia sp. NK8]
MSDWVVQHVHIASLDGWWWPFAIEGVPTISLGCLSFVILVDSPSEAKYVWSVRIRYIAALFF